MNGMCMVASTWGRGKSPSLVGCRLLDMFAQLGRLLDQSFWASCFWSVRLILFMSPHHTPPRPGSHLVFDVIRWSSLHFCLYFHSISSGCGPHVIVQRVGSVWWGSSTEVGLYFWARSFTLHSSTDWPCLRESISRPLLSYVVANVHRLFSLLWATSSDWFLSMSLSSGGRTEVLNLSRK